MRGAKPRLLVVDDDSDVLEVSSALLRYFGFAVVSTCDPYEALRLLENDTEIDGVVSDFRMPLMDGGQLASSVKGIRPNLPVFILSGTYPPEKHSGSWDGWFQKGGSVADFVAALSTVIFPQAGFAPELHQQKRNAS
jgi:CheY-like chemotaxis protein